MSPESGGLFIEPEAFEAPAVVDAVNEPLDIRLPADGSPGVIDDRLGAILGQPLLDLPYQLLALLLVELARLPVDQLVNFGIAIAAGVALSS